MACRFLPLTSKLLQASTTTLLTSVQAADERLAASDPWAGSELDGEFFCQVDALRDNARDVIALGYRLQTLVLERETLTPGKTVE